MGARAQPKQRTWGNAVPSLSEAAELKRASIVRAAAQCFNRSGFHGTSMDDIAARLGVSKAALYRYVSGKHDLLFEIFNLALDSGFAHLERGEAEGRNGLEKLRIALRGYLCDLIGKLHHPVVLLEENALLPEHSAAIIARRDAAERRYRKLIEQGIADGSVMASCNPKLAALALLGALNWVPKWYRADGEWSADQVADSLISLMMNSIAVRDNDLYNPARLKKQSRLVRTKEHRHA
jgi:TetR/AcrR family transcriptional regulator